MREKNAYFGIFRRDFRFEVQIMQGERLTMSNKRSRQSLITVTISANRFVHRNDEELREIHAETMKPTTTERNRGELSLSPSIRRHLVPNGCPRPDHIKDTL